MPREITSVADLQNPQHAATSTNDFKDRLVKLIPSEIVTAYITLQGLISGQTDHKSLYTWIVFISLLLLTPLYLYFISDVKKAGQIVFTTIAYSIWVLATGGFKIMLPTVTILTDFLGSLILIIYTLIIPFAYKG